MGPPLCLIVLELLTKFGECDFRLFYFIIQYHNPAGNCLLATHFEDNKYGSFFCPDCIYSY